MYKGETIYLRLFEPEDFEKTYAWRTNLDMQKLTCGPIRFVSKEIEKKWVLDKSTTNCRDIYMAICANESDKMVGYMSLNEIDYLNRTCVGGGIVIGDADYRDGFAYIEAELLEFDYVFNQLNMNRYSGECLRDHILSRANLLALGFCQEGIKRQAIYKNGKYNDVLIFSLLREEYYKLIERNCYTFSNIAKKTKQYIKEIKTNL